MENNLKNKVALITGASRGIGRCLCEHLSSLGIKVVAVARGVEKLKTLEEEIKKKGNEVSTYKMDVTDFEDIEKVVDKIVKKWGTIDILVNNAGTNVRSPIECLKKEEIDLVYDTNLKGTVYVTRHVAPVMIKANKGHIINISSLAGLRSPKGNGLYHSSKSGVIVFSDSIAKHLMKNNIYVTTLCPGAVDTSWWDRAGGYKLGDGDRKKIIQPSQIAKLVEFILNGEEYTLFSRVVLVPSGEVDAIGT